MPKIRYYQDHELEGLSEYELEVRRCASVVMHAHPDADIDELENTPLEKLKQIVARIKGEVADKPARAPKPPKPEPYAKLAKPVVIKPGSMHDAYRVVDGQLMQRVVTLYELMNLDGSTYKREVERLVKVGDRVTYEGIGYSSRILAHYLSTGEWVKRVTKPKRYKAQVRAGKRVIHLGYFDSIAERDAAVFAYRLGVNPKNAE